MGTKFNEKKLTSFLEKYLDEDRTESTIEALKKTYTLANPRHTQVLSTVATTVHHFQSHITLLRVSTHYYTYCITTT